MESIYKECYSWLKCIKCWKGSLLYIFFLTKNSKCYSYLSFLNSIFFLSVFGWFCQYDQFLRISDSYILIPRVKKREPVCVFKLILLHNLWDSTVTSLPFQLETTNGIFLSPKEIINYFTTQIGSFFIKITHQLGKMVDQQNQISHFIFTRISLYTNAF